MSQNPVHTESEGRRTSADAVFNALREDITGMRLRPGMRLSEAEIAKRYDVSRQPVREAFIRLDNLRLLQIRPQRATVVRPISREGITRARFIRLCVEVEIARRACERVDDSGHAQLQQLLDEQRARLEDADMDTFTALDYGFHSALCDIADCTYAKDTIRSCKGTTDRLCIPSPVYAKRAPEVLDDHCVIAERLAARDLDGLLEITRVHLSRLDATLDAVEHEHPEYFED